MIPRDMDYAFIGKNYLSILIGLDILRRKKRILIVDDKRLSLGECYTEHMTELSYRILKKWGERRGITSVFKNKQSFHQETVCFCTEKEKILLGRSPHENVKELLRKFPEIFGHKKHLQGVESLLKDTSSFDRIFFSYIDDLAEYLLLEKPKKGPSLNILRELAPKNILDIYQYILNSYHSIAKTLQGQMLFFSFRSFYQTTLNYKLDEWELFYLLLSMLSPGHRLETEEFTGEIISLFQSKGGLFKKADINAWDFHKECLRSIELNSYEGIILPKNLIFFGGRSTQIPFSWEDSLKAHETIKVVINDNTAFNEGAYVFSNAKSLGTSYPLILSFPKGKQLVFYLPLLKGNGAKVEFFKEHALNLISREIEKHFPNNHLRLENCHIRFSDDIWPIIQKRRNRLTCDRKIGLREIKKLKNVYYYGPFNSGILGPISPLLFFSC